MRSFVSVLVLFALSLIVAAALAYPLWLLVELIDHQPIHRVLHRIAMLCAVLGSVWLFRRWSLLNAESAGFGLPRREFWWQLGAALVSGVLIILPLLVLLYALDVRVADPRVSVTAALVAKVIAGGLATGLAVALIEEVFFRGLMHSAIERESGRLLAVILPSLLYAAVHFLDGRLHVPTDQIDWGSGMTVLSRMFIKYNDPAMIVDSFLALFAAGVLLALVRVQTGAIAACIGLHAAWVCALYYVEVTTQFNPAAAASWLAGSHDGVVGWGSVVWMAVIAFIYAGIARSSQWKPVHIDGTERARQ